MSEVNPHVRTFAELESLLRQHRRDPAAAIGHVTDVILRYRTGRLIDFLIRARGAVVQTGPFAGLRYLPNSIGSPLLPKLLGCYEAELHGVIDDIARKEYRTVVNVGCGEGYYAVGLAWLLPAARVYAFDTNELAQRLCRHLAGLNNVAPRVTVAGECSPERLEQLAGEGTLVVCDCEGCELQLLDPQAVPGLRKCDVLVELHDLLNPATSRDVCGRFRGTHEIQQIPHAGRDPQAFEALKNWKQIDQWLAVWEGKTGPTPWAFMTVR